MQVNTKHSIIYIYLLWHRIYNELSNTASFRYRNQQYFKKEQIQIPDGKNNNVQVSERPESLGIIGSQFEGPPETPGASQYYGIEWSSGWLAIEPH